MANWTNLKAAITDTITTNGNQEITGSVLQNTLNAIVNAIGANATFAGVATPSTNPGMPDGPVFYLAGISGIYSNFGIVVQDEIAVIANSNNNSWVKATVLGPATAEQAGMMSAEDKKKLVKSITWNNDTNPSNMNDFVVAGAYDIKGDHKRVDDNLPILNIGGGHSFNARLTVLDSSISGTGETDDKCITQVLSFSNRLGQGEVYIRTGKGSSLDNLTWEKWSTLQRNVNVGQVNTLNDLIDNGIYSGVFTDGTLTSVGTFYDTFVLIVINNYAVSIPTSNPQSISQLKYSLGLDGSISVVTRKRDQYGYWTEWESIEGGGSAVNANTLDFEFDEKRVYLTFHDIDKNNDTPYNVLLPTVSTIGAGVMTAADKKKLDASIKNVEVSPEADEVELDLEVTGNIYHVPFPAATTEKAGVMTAADKKKLDSLSPGGGGGGDITATPTEKVIEEIEPTLVSTAIRKTPQVLTDSEKEIARENIGAVGFSDLNNAIAEAITNTLNTAV